MSPVQTPVKQKQNLQVRRMQKVKNREKSQHMCLSSLGEIPPELPINLD
jgi:hypothetical protein